MSIVELKTGKDGNAPLLELTKAVMALLLSIALSLAANNPNYEPGIDTSGYYFRTGTYFLAPLIAIATLVIAAGEVEKKPKGKAILLAVGDFLVAVAYVCFATTSMEHYKDVGSNGGTIYFLASVLLALPFLYQSILQFLLFTGNEGSEKRFLAADALFGSLFGCGALTVALAIFLSPRAHQGGEVLIAAPFYLLLIAMVLALASGVFHFVAEAKKGSLQGKGRIVSGVLLAISGLLLMIDSFIVDTAEAYLYELFYYLLAIGIALLVTGAIYASFPEWGPRLALFIGKKETEESMEVEDSKP